MYEIQKWQLLHGESDVAIQTTVTTDKYIQIQRNTCLVEAFFLLCEVMMSAALNLGLLSIICVLFAPLIVERFINEVFLIRFFFCS